MTWGAYPWPLLVLSSAGLIVGLTLLLTRESQRSMTWTWLGRIATAGSLAWTGWLLWTLADHYTTLQALTSNQITVTEGFVDNYSFFMHDGHGFESFTVEGVPFHYSDFLATGAYNRPASQGGVIRPGLRVRIAHRGNTIAKLEAADAP